MDAQAYTARSLPRQRGRVDATAAAGPRGPLAAALGCLVAFALLYAIASQVAAARVHDASLLYHATLLATPHLERAGLFVLHLLDPGVFIFWAAAIVIVGFARGRPRRALAAGAVLMLAPFTTETLKPLLAHAHDSVGGVHIGAASFPSGHSTAAAVLVLAALLVAPARTRPAIAAAGACFAVAVGVLLVVLAWHMPSDVLGGYLVAGFWAALALAVVRRDEGAARRRVARG